MRSWTDFLKVRLHPRSMSLLPGRWQGAEDFSGFGHGRGALVSDEAREDALDRIRGFAEECDSLQVSRVASTSYSGEHFWVHHCHLYDNKHSNNADENHVICCVTLKPEFSGCVVKPRLSFIRSIGAGCHCKSHLAFLHIRSRRCNTYARKIEISSAPCASCVASLTGV